MVAPSKLHAARTARDRKTRIRLMAETMRHHASGPEDACTLRHLFAAGFTEAEIETYRDDARAMMRATPPVVVAASAARMEGQRLVQLARKIRKRAEAGGRA